MTQSFSVTVKNRKFGVKISEAETLDNVKLYLLQGVGWNFNTKLTSADLVDFITSGNIQYLIEQELKEKEKPKTRFQFRLTEAERKYIEKKAYTKGFSSISDYARNQLLVT